MCAVFMRLFLWVQIVNKVSKQFTINFLLCGSSYTKIIKLRNNYMFLEILGEHKSKLNQT